MQWTVETSVSTQKSNALRHNDRKCDHVMGGDQSGMMFDHVIDFSTVSVKFLGFYVKELHFIIRYTVSERKWMT